MAKEKKKSLRDELDELRETVDAIKEATVDEAGKKSMPPSLLQRGVERAAGASAWDLAKDVGRAFTPARLEALARNKMRGEDYDDAKAKAEETRENLEGRRSGLAATGAAVQGIAATAAGIALYAKLAGGGSSPAAPAAAPAAPAVTPKGNLKAMGKLGLVAVAGAAIGSLVMSRAGSKQEASPQAPSTSPASSGAPVSAAAPAAVAGAAVVAAAARTRQSAPPAAFVSQSAKAKAERGQPRPAQRASQQRASGQRRQAKQDQRRGTGPIRVKGYTRKDGVQVQDFERTRPF